MSTDAIRADDEDAATTELVTGAVGGRCVNCQSSLASDQRYCLACGERRGKPRFPLAPVAAPGGSEAAASKRPTPQRPRFSSGTTLVAGIATLLLAMGVGVLIGHNSSSGPTRAAAPVQVLTVGGAGASAATAAGTAASPTFSSSAASKSHHVKTKAVVVHLTPKVTKAATAAAAKVFGSGNKLTHNATQQLGSSCGGGAGCQNGKFTGNFFPGG